MDGWIKFNSYFQFIHSLRKEISRLAINGSQQASRRTRTGFFEDTIRLEDNLEPAKKAILQ